MIRSLPAESVWKVPARPRWEPAKLPVTLGQTEEQVKAIVASAMLIPLAISVATAYVGFRLGSIDKGFPAVLGYGVGALGALGALGSLLITLGVMKTPFPSRPTTTPVA